jgi:hypothetical protein
MPQPTDDDRTIKLTRPSPFAADPLQGTTGSSPAPVRAARLPVWAICASALLAILVGTGTWLLWPATRPPATGISTVSPSPSAAMSPAARVPSTTEAGIPPVAASALATGASPSAARGLQGPVPSPDQADFNFEIATEQQILDHIPVSGASDPTVFRFAPNPRILVLDFASLLSQGRMLNRVAALVEKSGLPHDRVTTSFEIAAAIRASGDTVETFYYGHDYDAGSVIRFFTLADRDNIRLVPEEDRLGRLIRQAGWFEANARSALISIPQVGADAHVTRAARATILHHELSHGEYFTNPAYMVFVHQFWTQTLTATERDRIRRHLRSVGYDQNLDEVMENEAQAYLIFTDGAEFFTPDMIGMSETRLAELRSGFFLKMPAGWLHDNLGQTLGLSRKTADRP